MYIYQIASDYAEFIERFDEGEIPEDAFYDTLEGLHGVFEEKCVAVACSVKNDEAMVEALKTEIAKLNERKAALERRVNSKKESLLRFMDAVQVSKITGYPQAQLTIKKNPPKVVFADKTEFLARAKANGWNNYLTTPQPEINTSAVKAALNNGGTIAGVYLEQGKRVDIS